MFSGYLKLWQLSKPFLTSYDAIFVDEAQDCTPGDELFWVLQPQDGNSQPLFSKAYGLGSCSLWHFPCSIICRGYL